MPAFFYAIAGIAAVCAWIGADIFCACSAIPIERSKLKIVINDENFELNSVKKAILVLENYINFNLDTNINAKKMLWGALLW